MSGQASSDTTPFGARLCSEWASFVSRRLYQQIPVWELRESFPQEIPVPLWEWDTILATH